MRNVSSNIQAILDQGFGETKDVAIITIKGQTVPTVIPETKLYLGNGDNIFIGGVLYSNKLRGVGTVKFSLGKAPDGAEITIENVSLDLGNVLTETDRLIDGAKVEIFKAFKTTPTSYETVPVFTGQVKDTKVDQDLITLTVVSDMSKRGTSVASRTATQRCIFKFNKNGDGSGPSCGWQTTQPGNAASCDHDLTSPNGCVSHGNQHRFGGVPAFTAFVDPNNGYDPSGSGWGDSPTGGWCLFWDDYVLCENLGQKFWVKAYQVKPDEVVVTTDMFGRLQKTKVITADRGTTTKLYTVVTKLGCSLSCSPSHPIITGFKDLTGKPCHTLKPDDTVLVYVNGTLMEDVVDSIESVGKTTTVILFGLEEPYHTFISGKNKSTGLVQHNMKPIGGGEIGGFERLD